MGRPLEVGLVGYGLGGETFHAPLIHATPGLRLAALVTRDAGRRAAAARRYPQVSVVATVEELATLRPALDLLAISSPSGTHASIARVALEAGMHVVVDKPFAVSSAEARDLGALAQRQGRLAIPFQNRRWDGDFLTVQRLLRDGTLGEIARFESRFERWRAAAKPRWRLPDARRQAEGIVYDIATHLIDQALVLFGPVREVYGELDRRLPGVEVEDDAFIALLHANGVRSHLYMSSAAAQSGPRMTVHGSRGAYVKHGLDGQEAALGAGGDPASPEWGAERRERWGTIGIEGAVAPLRTERGQYPAFYAGVARAIQMGEAPPVTVEEAVATLDVIEAVFRSAEEGRAVMVG